jgi:methylmalonyl-CoA mutase
VVPHDAALGVSSPKARALARAMQHLLLEESHLAAVADPLAGAGAVEALTESLAERAWTEFQAIEREGGIAASLAAGLFQSRVAAAREALRIEVAGGAAPLVGATVLADPAEPAPDFAPIADSASGLAPVRLELLARAAA